MHKFPATLLSSIGVSHELKSWTELSVSAMRLETGADCPQGLKLDRGILLSQALARNSTISWNSSIPAVLSFTTDLIGEKMEDGPLRFV